MPLGTFSLDLDEGSSEAETIPGSPDRVSSSSIATTVEIIELTESDDASSEVEIVEAQIVKPLTPEKESHKMRDEEKYGHFYRLELHQQGVQDRLRGVREAIASDTPEERRVRRCIFRQQLYGEALF